MIYWAKMSCGGLKKIEAPNRKEASRKAHATGYEVFKITRDGGNLFNGKGQPR